MTTLNNDAINFELQCVADEAKVFYHNGNVYRAIYNKQQAQLYNRLFNEIDFEVLFEAGLVPTKICNDIKIENCDLVLEHETIDFFLDPCEMTNKMFWDAAKTYIDINKILAEHNLILKDAHPWNITFYKGKAVFFDFTSVYYSQKLSASWFNEFYTYFAVPIVLAHSKWPYFSNEYRRQHLNGLGLKLSEHHLVKKFFFKSIIKLSRYLNNPIVFFYKLQKWLLKFKPESKSGNWDDYDQSNKSSYLNPTTVKQKFVYNVLNKENPKKVADLATNKGYFAFMAESVGAKVIGFDYEEYSVDKARQLITNENISFCQMNFLIPTSKKGWGLLLPDAFQRFNADIALALGLIHHVCLAQGFPVKLFCDSCAKYANKGVILEFVYPEDLHVKKWNAKIPADYNKEGITGYFHKYYNTFIQSDIITDSGIKRQFFYFFNG